MTSPTLDALFRPFRIKSLELKNRIVMAPMTRSFSPGGIPGENVAAYYRRRAENEVGLILSEGTVIDRPASRSDPDVSSFYGDEALAGWQRVADEVHAAGGKMGPQLWHVGSTRNMLAEWDPGIPVESPSGLVAPGDPRGEAMTEEAIADTIEAFGRAAGNAKRLGFDTVELQGAHGFLIDQFFWAGTNLRTDRYGGATIRERSRFAAETIRRVRQVVGPDFPILLRVSQWKPQDYAARLAETPDRMLDWLGPLVEAGVDVLHCSQRRFWQAEFPEIDGQDGLNFAGWAKKLTGAATIGVGSVGMSVDFISAMSGGAVKASGIGELIRRLEREEFDLIAIGRALLNDPYWVTKIRSEDQSGLKDFDPAALAELV